MSGSQNRVIVAGMALSRADVASFVRLLPFQPPFSLPLRCLLLRINL